MQMLRGPNVNSDSMQALLHCFMFSLSYSCKLQAALFPGDSEVQQLLHIFKLLGTPSEDVWPGVKSLRDWHEFPQWKPQPLEKVFVTLEPAGVDLMKKMFAYDPAERITVRFYISL